MKRLIANNVLKLSVISAKVSCNSASMLGFCQPKEPVALAAKVAKIEGAK